MQAFIQSNTRIFNETTLEYITGLDKDFAQLETCFEETEHNIKL